MSDSIQMRMNKKCGKKARWRYVRIRRDLPLPVQAMLWVVALVLLGGTNDTLLAQHQHVFIGIFVAGSALNAMVVPRRFNHLERSVLLLAFIIALTAAIELFFSIEKQLTMRIGLYFWIYFLCMLFYAKVRIYVYLLKCIRICAAILGGSIVLSAMFRDAFVSAVSFWLTNIDRVMKDVGYGQFSGLIGDRAFAAIAMCIGIFAELSSMITRGKATKGSIFSIMLCLIAMLLTGKRITIMMLIGGLVAVMLLTGNRESRKAVIGILLALVVFASIAMIAFPQTRIVLYRILDGLPDTTFNDRIHFWRTAWKMFLEKPFFGWGLGSYLRYNFWFGDGIMQYAHNMYLQLLAERGAVGSTIILMLFAMAFMVTFQTAREAFRSKKKEMYEENSREQNARYMLCLFSLMSQVGFFLYGLTGYPIYNLHQGFLYAICIAMVISVRAEMRIQLS